MGELTRELLLLRHAKSSWDSGVATDFERPLAGRGERDAPRMGCWLAEQGLEPDHVISSTARRAEQTVLRVLKELDGAGPEIEWEERIYEASPATLLAILEACPPTSRRVLLVGHNPGMEMLVDHLAAGDVNVSATGKSMPTAALAHFRMPEDWSDLPRGAGKLVRVARPKEI